MALVTAGACAPPPRPVVIPDRPITLAIVTWNMHIGAGDLPRLLSDLAAGALTGTPPSDYVVMLQEVMAGGQHDPAVSARERQLSIAYEDVRTRKEGPTGNAILSTLTLKDMRVIDLPRAREPRKAMVVTITLAGQALFIANTHLENRVSLLHGLMFVAGARGRQAEAIVAALPPGPGIAGGDLNTWLGMGEPALKVFGARFTGTPAGQLGPTVADRLPLDHLFFDVPDGWQVERHVLPDKYGSDHHPVIGLVTVPSRPAATR